VLEEPKKEEIQVDSKAKEIELMAKLEKEIDD